MNTTTVAGPFGTEDEAQTTAETLGLSNHSVFSRYISDDEGYLTEQRDWFVERHNDLMPATIFGHSPARIAAMQGVAALR